MALEQYVLYDTLSVITGFLVHPPFETRLLQLVTSSRHSYTVRATVFNDIILLQLHTYSARCQPNE
jgi:hypothetical protein